MTTKIAIVGATGETGGSIINGLLGSETQFVRTSTLPAFEKPATVSLKERGIKIVPIDLGGSHDELASALTGIDIVISAIHFQSLDDEIPLSNAAKKAGVKRYVPCFFATIAPRGIMDARDRKEAVLDHIQRIYLPYTVIDVGWWYQITLPRVPSGKLDESLVSPNNYIIAGGDIPSALTDVRDIGKYVAAIVSDPRTINKRVLGYTESKTQNEIHKLVETVLGEKPEPTTLSKEQLEEMLAPFKGSTEQNQMRSIYEYWMSWGVRGDNTPENAVYLGYVLAKDLYPSLQGRSLEEFIKDAAEGSAKKVYQQ
ncbi:isoflavone reductase [Fusarium phyllophilum]|uniref:Isoflavone reductase n=1 Tax=Fusarium phyllophilum TaxID=47803 RepID=A0A8H5KEQ1_9HYPO|nr:isoflavone reductase [Fusarium phyllophilum]